MNLYRLEVKRSKVKVTRPINAYIVNAQYLPNGKAYELQASYTHGPRTCTEHVLKLMDAGYCLYVHIFMKNIKSLEPFNFL